MLHSLTKPQLQAKARVAGLKPTGTKSNIRRRLKAQWRRLIHREPYESSSDPPEALEPAEPVKPAELNNMSYKALQKTAKQLNVTANGKKTDLVKRLTQQLVGDEHQSVSDVDPTTGQAVSDHVPKGKTGETGETKAAGLSPNPNPNPSPNPNAGTKRRRQEKETSSSSSSSSSSSRSSSCSSSGSKSRSGDDEGSHKEQRQTSSTGEKSMASSILHAEIACARLGSDKAACTKDEKCMWTSNGWFRRGGTCKGKVTHRIGDINAKSLESLLERLRHRNSKIGLTADEKDELQVAEFLLDDLRLVETKISDHDSKMKEMLEQRNKYEVRMEDRTGTAADRDNARKRYDKLNAEILKQRETWGEWFWGRKSYIAAGLSILALAGLSTAALSSLAPGTMHAVQSYYRNRSNEAIAEMKAAGDVTKIEAEKLRASAQDHAAHGQYYKDSGWDKLNHAGARTANIATTAGAAYLGPTGWAALAVEDGGKVLDMTGRAGTQLATSGSAIQSAWKGDQETYVGTTPLLQPLRVYENPITKERYITTRDVAKSFPRCVSRNGRVDPVRLLAELLRRFNSRRPS